MILCYYLIQWQLEENVIKSFQDHLISKSRKGDFVIFHYSGHGGLERSSDKLKSYGFDELQRGFLCYDSGGNDAHRLVEYELQYLIYQLSEKECNILIIQDCCNSGRNRYIDSSPKKEVASRGTTKITRSRRWEEYLFASDFPSYQEKLIFETFDSRLPKGKHISLSSCSVY